MKRSAHFLTIMMGVLSGVGAARAADVFVEPLAATGLPEDALPAFQAAIEQSFDKAGHTVVRPGRAAFRAKPSITKDRSRYELTVRVLTAPGNMLVAEKTAECAPCTLDQAQKQVELLVRTVSLNLEAAAESAAPSPSPPAPSSARVPPTPATLVPAATGPLRLQLEQAPPPPRKAPQRYEFTSWYRVMMWTSFLPAAAGTLSVLRLQEHTADRNRCGRPGYSECPHDNKLFLASLGLMLAVEGWAVINFFDLVVGEPGQGRNFSTLGIAVGLATSASLGLLGYLLIKNDGYGSDFYKKLGYADLPLAALALTTSLGSLIAGPERPVLGSTTAFVGPGIVGIGGRF